MNPKEKQRDEMQQTINNWFIKNYIDEATKDSLLQTIKPQNSNKNILITFSIIGTISCGILAFGTLVMDEKWIELFRRELNLSEGIVAIVFAIATILFIYLTKRRAKKTPHLFTVNEAYHYSNDCCNSTGLWWGAQTYFWSGNAACFLGMIIRCVSLCLVILASPLQLQVTD